MKFLHAVWAVEDMEETDRRRWIAQWVQQFKGYADGENRRASDTAFREYVLRRIDWYAKRLAEVAGSPPAIADADRLTKTIHVVCSGLRDLADQLNAVPYAFGEFMNARSIPPADLEEFYQRDQEVLRHLANFQSLIDPTITEQTNAARLSDDLLQMIESLSTAVTNRQSRISEYVSDPRITGYY